MISKQDKRSSETRYVKKTTTQVRCICRDIRKGEQ